MKKFEKYAVDRIEGKFAVLENIDTREIKLVELLLLPVVKEKDILIYKDGFYMQDSIERRRRLKTIQEKLNKLKSVE
ncbi:MAG: DUF3006 domain-containing protein [Bacilli bacterium]|nr:DUF3006 domain-containing protein [Bacilli bacterium]